MTNWRSEKTESDHSRRSRVEIGEPQALSPMHPRALLLAASSEAEGMLALVAGIVTITLAGVPAH